MTRISRIKVVITTTIVVIVAFNATTTLPKPLEVIYFIDITIYNFNTTIIPLLTSIIKAFSSL